MKIVYLGPEPMVIVSPIKMKSAVFYFNVPKEVPDDLGKLIFSSHSKDFITYEDWLKKFGNQEASAPVIDWNPDWYGNPDS